MNTLMGIIYLNETDLNSKLSLLTSSRCIASTPFLGNYRLIDFILTNMANSQIQNVAIFTTKKYRALMNHLGSGKEWDLDKKQDGLFLFFPTWSSWNNNYNFDLDLFYENIDYFLNSQQSYVVLAPGNIVGSIDFQRVLDQHIKSNAHITSLKSSNNNYQKHEKELGIYVLEKKLFVDLLITSKNQGFSGSVTKFLKKAVNNNYNISVNYFPNNKPVLSINDITDYYYYSMKLLNPEIRNKFLNTHPLTKLKDLPPTRYRQNAQVSNSLIAEGCNINGKVNTSILFHSVTVEEGTNISNSIIFPENTINQNVLLSGVISDKNVSFTKNTSLAGTKNDPYVIAKYSRV